MGPSSLYLAVPEEGGSMVPLPRRLHRRQARQASTSRLSGTESAAASRTELFTSTGTRLAAAAATEEERAGGAGGKEEGKLGAGAVGSRADPAPHPQLVCTARNRFK